MKGRPRKLDPKRVGRRLREARNSMGLLQRELGAPGHVSRMEAGLTVPGGETLFKWAQECRVSADWLLGLKD
jgi:transcriptional regulator with XRE-family HTH domain